MKRKSPVSLFDLLNHRIWIIWHRNKIDSIPKLHIILGLMKFRSHYRNFFLFLFLFTLLDILCWHYLFLWFGLWYLWLLMNPIEGMQRWFQWCLLFIRLFDLLLLLFYVQLIERNIFIIASRTSFAHFYLFSIEIQLINLHIQLNLIPFLIISSLKIDFMTIIVGLGLFIYDCLVWCLRLELKVLLIGMI